MMNNLKVLRPSHPIIDTNVLFPQAWVTVADFGNPF
jgi:hypothetical protein